MDSAYLPYIVDGILLLLFVITVINAARIGFARSIAGIAAWVLASFVALHFCADAAQWTYANLVRERVVQAVQEQVTDVADAAETADITTAILEGLPDEVVDAARAMDIDVDALLRRTSSFDLHSEYVAQEVEREVLAPIILAALKALLFFLMVLAVSCTVRVLLTPVGKALHKLPVIGTADRALGGALGVLKGAVLISVLAILIRVAAGIVGGEFAKAASMSKIVTFVAESPFADGLFRSA